MGLAGTLVLPLGSDRITVAAKAIFSMPPNGTPDSTPTGAKVASAGGPGEGAPLQSAFLERLA